MLFKKSSVIMLIVSAFSLTTMLPAFAKYTPKISVDTAGKTAYLVVNGRKAIDFLVSNGSVLPIERARVAAERLKGHASKNFNLDYISFKQTENDARILVDDQLLIIATKADAKAHLVTVSELASAWTGNLKEALSVPPLSASPLNLLLPLGETRVLNIESLQSDPVEAEIGDPKIISADPNPKPGSLIISGKSLGNSTITLKCGDSIVLVQVSVKKYAAYRSAQPVRSIVTGLNAPASLVERAARDAARRSLYIETGANIQSINITTPVKELAPGKSIMAQVKMQVTGGDYIPAQFDLPVQVENKQMSAMQPSWIMYSNDPERITKYQTLFTGRLDDLKKSVRLLYHHQNMSGKEVGFTIEILNPSPSPASVHIMDGIADPIIDTVIVGYKAGLEFMGNHRSLVGRIIELPAASRWIILSQNLPIINTTSGLIEFRQLTGNPLFVRVTAEPESDRVANDPPGVSLPIGGTTIASLPLSDHIYPEPEKKIDTTYTVGKSWVFLRIGKNAIKHASQDKLLYGNYGVTYTINAKLENPTQLPQKIEIAYEATAGPVSGIFYVDGKQELIRLLSPPLEKSISTFTIPAGQTKNVAIRTMPLSGSAYPSTLIIRPAGTMASSAKN
ncbi:MAG: hypothetical protein ACYC0V_08690 [Armatimonadota bacterium]